jgi:hypothetical protein
MSAIPQACVIHALRGRTRMRVPERRGDTRYFETVREGLCRLDGVGPVEINPTTGSILVWHATPFDDVSGRAQQSRLFAVDRSLTAAPPAASSSELGPSIRSPFGPLANPRLAAFALLLGLGLIQLLRGQVMPPAISLLWYATTALFLPLERLLPSEADKPTKLAAE